MLYIDGLNGLAAQSLLVKESMYRLRAVFFDIFIVREVNAVDRVNLIVMFLLHFNVGTQNNENVNYGEIDIIMRILVDRQWFKIFTAIKYKNKLRF